MYNWDRKNCPLYGVAGCPLLRGCLNIEVNGRAVGTFRIVCYIVGVRYSGVSVKRGSTVYRGSTVHNLEHTSLSQKQQKFEKTKTTC